MLLAGFLNSSCLTFILYNLGIVLPTVGINDQLRNISQTCSQANLTKAIPQSRLSSQVTLGYIKLATKHCGFIWVFFMYFKNFSSPFLSEPKYPTKDTDFLLCVSSITRTSTRSLYFIISSIFTGIIRDIWLFMRAL